jgi:hypothetical protein
MIEPGYMGISANIHVITYHSKLSLTTLRTKNLNIIKTVVI